MVAVGTTVVRALETAADEAGTVTAAIRPDRRAHHPRPDLLAASYEAALEHGYLWHEFGDAQLILP